MITGLHHTAIHVEDMEKMVKFYRDVLGLKVIWDVRTGYESGKGFDTSDVERITGVKDAKVWGVCFYLGEPRPANKDSLELVQYENPKARQNPEQRFFDARSFHVALHVDDIQKEYKRLAAKGCKFTIPPHEFKEGAVKGMKETFLIDPEGNQIQLVEW